MMIFENPYSVWHWRWLVHNEDHIEDGFFLDFDLHANSALFHKIKKE